MSSPAPTPTPTHPVCFTPGQVAGILSRRVNRRVCPSTVVRWVVKGLVSIDGSVVRLPASRVGSRWYVEESELDKFFRRMAAPTDTQLVPNPRTQSRRQSDSQAAVAELEARGG
jgi:hypothetical protein